MNVAIRWTRDRWFLLGVAFLVVNTWAVTRGPYRPPDGGSDTCTVAFDAGRNAVVRRLDTVRWTFSKAMVEARDVLETLDRVPVRIEPEVAGIYRWASDRILTFTPLGPWPSATVFQTAIEKPGRSLAGEPISGETHFTFSSHPLDLLSVSQVDFQPGRSCTLRLDFNTAPKLRGLEDFIGIVDANRGRKVRYRLVGDSESPAVLIRVEPARSDRLKVKVRKGLLPATGDLGLAADAVRKVRCVAGFAFQRLEPEIRPLEQSVVRMYFSAPVDLQGMESVVHISPEVNVTYEHVRHWNESGVAVIGDFKPRTTYTFTLDATLASTLGQRLGKPVTRRVYMPDVPPALRMHGSGQYLSAAGNRTLRFSSVNVGELALTVERVHANNLVQFAMRKAGNYRHFYRWRNEVSHEGLARKVGEATLMLSSPPNEMFDTLFNVGDLLGGERSGAFIISVEPDKGASLRRLVVLTDLGLSVKHLPHEVLVWVNSIRTAQPVSNATVEVYSKANQLLASGVTDSEGRVQVETPANIEDGGAPFLVTARYGDDLSYLALESRARVTMEGDVLGRPWADVDLDAFLHTDRGIYRPGGKIHVRAVVRDRDLECPEPFPVRLRYVGPDGRAYQTRTGLLNDFGVASFDWTWPDHVPTGRYRLELSIPGSEAVLGSTAVAVEEFAPPRIAASIHIEPERLPGNEPFSFEVTGRYLTGRPAAHCPVTGRVHFEPADFAPEGWDGYIFRDGEKDFPPTDRKLGTGRLDDEGAARFTGKADGSWRPPSAVKAVLTATVRETGGRATSAHATRTMDVYPYYLGLRPRETSGTVPTGQPYIVDVVIVSPDGRLNPQSRSLRARIDRISWANVLKKNAEGIYGYHSERCLTPVDSRSLEVKEGKAAVESVPEVSGRYLLTVSDVSTESSSSVQFDVAVPGSRWVDWALDRPDRIVLELDREDYTPGQTAHLVIRSPFAGRAMLTVETDRIIETRVLDLPAGRAEAEIVVSRELLPNAYCAVTLLRPLQAGEAMVPHRAVGMIALKVREPERRLSVRLKAPEEMQPRRALTVDIDVAGHDGQPAEAEVVVAAVDEGICLLTGFDAPDPLSYFRAKRATASRFFDLYSALLPEVGVSVQGAASAAGGGAGSALSRSLNPIRARRFRPVALWSGPVTTDETGKASVEFEVPEFTGRLRIMAVAIGQRRFGSAEEQVVVKRPIQAYFSLPRFLAPGDRCDATLTLVNEAAAAGTLVWSLESEGPVEVTRPSGDLRLVGGKEKAVSVGLRAGDVPGVARLRLRVTSGPERFEEVIELPVRPPAAHEVRTGALTVQPGSREEIRLPTEWVEGTAEYSLIYSGLPELRFAGSLDFLIRYPYGCVEQTTSSVFPLLFLADLANAVQAGSMVKEDTANQVNAGILRLLSMQRSGGGFAYWPRTKDIYPWGSLYATHFLVEASRSGYGVPEDRLAAALRYAEKLLSASAPAWSSDDGDFVADRLRRAYACHVLAAAGKPHHGWMSRLMEEAPRLHFGTIACLGSALALSDRREDAARVLRPVVPETGADDDREISGCLSSPVRDLGLLLSAWLEVDPTDVRSASLAQRLLDFETEGRWSTTHESAIALMALGKYAQQTAGLTRSFEGEVWWAGGKSHYAVSSAEVWKGKPKGLGRDPMTVSNDGPGTACFYWRAEGVPRRGLPKETDRGLRVRRRLLNRDGDAIPERSVKQGQLLVVELTLDTLGRTLDQLVIEDLLPAGLEPENAGLNTSEVLPWLRDRRTLPVRHMEARDDRALFFTASFSGRKSVYHLVRAVTPGRYVWPPATASCMYDPSARSVHGARIIEVAACVDE